MGLGFRGLGFMGLGFYRSLKTVWDFTARLVDPKPSTLNPLSPKP